MKITTLSNTMEGAVNDISIKKNTILEAIGNTPLVRLQKVVQGVKPAVYAKLEYMNPGGSIKDRMALYMIEDAERKGILKKGGTIIENTSGNTGLGLAMIAAVKGYKAIFTIADKMSQEKIDLLKAYGATVVVTPTDVPHDDPRSYYETARRIARETPNSFYVNQYNNPMNPLAHYKTTGPEIWKQCNGKIDYLIAGIGTGGTLSGIGKYLKEQNPQIKIIGVDPKGSIFYDYFKTKKMVKPHVYQVEGIGEDFLVGAIDFTVMDDIIQINDRDSFLAARKLAREEGIFAGGSSGSALLGTLEVSEKLDASKVVVTIFPDSGTRYLSKMYNDEWMKEKGHI